MQVGELCECFQWRPDASTTVGLPGWSDAGKMSPQKCSSPLIQIISIQSQRKNVMIRVFIHIYTYAACVTVIIYSSPTDRHHLGEEMSDVLLYLVRLADKCDVNLADAVQQKIQKNAVKYPAHLVKARNFFPYELSLSLSKHSFSQI